MRGGGRMITYSELMQTIQVIIAIAGFVVTAIKINNDIKRSNRLSAKQSGYFLNLTILGTAVVGQSPCTFIIQLFCCFVNHFSKICPRQALFGVSAGGIVFRFQGYALPQVKQLLLFPRVLPYGRSPLIIYTMRINYPLNLLFFTNSN